jgi:general secretion pathway protein C
MRTLLPTSGRGLRASALLDYARALGGHRVLAAVVNAGALAFVAYSLAQSTWRIAQPERRAAPVAAAAVTPQAEFDGRALQAASLFGAFSALAAQRVDEALPRATLNLVLTGVAMRGAKSYALISGEGRPETAYGVGEQIVPGVVLEAVHADRVVIVQRGVRQWLMMKELASALPAGGTPAAAVPAGVSALSTGPGGSVLDRQAVKRLLQRPDFLSQALIVPNAGGGFRVGQVQAGSLYEKLGLRVGDVIRSVNGQPINNMEEVMGLYQQLGTATEVNVEVLRGGVAQSLHVSLR